MARGALHRCELTLRQTPAAVINGPPITVTESLKTPDMTIVTRFAPSPTGFLHIGGARTALFNWLYARKHEGKMLLRIEDTDRERSTEAAIAAILDGLTWIGIEWDGDVVYQFSRAARHREIAEQLLAEGKAYRCYATAEELAEMREKARAEGRAKLYDGRWRDRDPADAPANVKPTIRLKAPLTGETVIEDQVFDRQKRRAEARRLTAAEHGVNPRQQFDRRKWFGNVVIRAALKTVHPVLYRRPRRQHDHRNTALCSDLMQHAESIAVRQHDVEDDQHQAAFPQSVET